VTDELPMSGLVDHARLGRRLRRWLTFLAVATFAAWLIGGLVGEGPTLRGLAGLIGVAVLLALLVEVLVVGGAAVGAALRAGAQGERLSAADVALVPPQLRRRRARGVR
jgi:branched-subunit amino acid transport protein